VLKKLLKKIINKTGYSVVKQNSSTQILPNVFNSSHPKTALLSYVKNVFNSEESKNDKKHTNRYTTYLFAEVLNNLEYNVDVINYNEDFIGDINKYNLVIGLGKVLDYALEKRDTTSTTKVVYFATGCNPFFSNPITINRVVDFYQRNNILIPSSSRYIKEDWPLQHECADWIIVHGNNFALSTFRPYNIDFINAPVFINQSIKRTNADWLKAKQNYLWFGSDGAIHKGLDLVIDSFKEMQHVNIHICGNLEREKEFLDFYNTIIKSCPNIIYHGFVDIDSDLFKNILRDCAFVILPSASEGNSPSVITCMANGGQIPVVTKNTDITFKNYGVLIEDLTVASVTDSILKSQELSLTEIMNQSAEIIIETKQLNSFSHFKNDFEQKLKLALKSIESNEM
jgi:glycosyltransferase involved in cell wall biosynthesis